MVYHFIKRSLDLIGASLALIVFSPIIFLVAILVKLSSDGPVLVEESSRVGKNGKIFRMYKFRSMIKNSHTLIRTNPKYKELLEKYKENSFKLVGDPRVTRVGQVLRRTSMDELPQLLNVIKGDMSLIGPRAYYPDELEEQRKKYPNCKDFIVEALKVRPGITGLWQVSGRSKVDFEKRIEMDANYSKSKSLITDFRILLKTPVAILAGEGI